MASKNEIRDSFLSLWKKGWDAGPAMDLLKDKYPDQQNKIIDVCADTLFTDILGLPNSRRRKN